MVITKAKYKDIENFEYQLRVKSNDLTYDTQEFSLNELILNFKKNKKHVDVKYPLNSYSMIMNNIYRFLLRHENYCSFVIKEDYSFIIGYHELKYLYRWMYKGIPLITNDNLAIYYKDLSPRTRDLFERQQVRVRVFTKDTNINNLIKHFFESPIRFPLKDESIVDIGSEIKEVE